MPFFAEYDPSESPAPVLGWFHVFHETEDKLGFVYPTLPAEDRLLELTQEQWDNHFKPSSTWAVQNGTLISYRPQPSFEVLALVRKQQAKSLFDKSTQDVVLRCFEEAVPVPDEWKAYRATLRRIADGAEEEIPTLPSLPAF